LNAQLFLLFIRSFIDGDCHGSTRNPMVNSYYPLDLSAKFFVRDPDPGASRIEAYFSPQGRQHEGEKALLGCAIK
jgi:hypothetical protein